jgi:DNA modification methylase
VEPCVLIGTEPGDLVLDPFFGSGTVGVVAHVLQRRYLGIELNPDYVQIARKRLGMVAEYAIEHRGRARQYELLESVPEFEP